MRVEERLDRDGARCLHRAADGDSVVEVWEDARSRWLQFGTGVIQSLMDLERPERLVLPYTRAMAGALLFQPRPAHCLVVGLGAASLPRFLAHHHPATTFDLVERSGAVHAAARRFFDPRGAAARWRVHETDARVALADLDRPADLAYLDVFDAGGLPCWMRDPAIYRLARARLAPGGVLGVNLWVDDADEFFEVMSGAREVFDGRVLVATVAGYRNIVVFCFADGPRAIPLPPLYEQARGLRATHGIDHPALVDRLREANLVTDDRLIL